MNSESEELLDNIARLKTSFSKLRDIALSSLKELEQYKAIGTAEEFKNYKDAEEQGLLLRLPCKIDDKLWWFDAFGDLRTSKVNSMFVEFGIDGIVIETLICNVYANDIGKTVFLTKEEAEQALKQIGEREDESNKSKYRNTNVITLLSKMRTRGNQ